MMIGMRRMKIILVVVQGTTSLKSPTKKFLRFTGSTANRK